MSRPNVKRCVVTSSVACIVNSEIKPPHTYVRVWTTALTVSFTEEDWNEISVPICEKLGREADGANKYRGMSKLLHLSMFFVWHIVQALTHSVQGPGGEGVLEIF